ncbi:TPA: hypothetical protein DCR49_02100 [Candidatus Delongbacteria bacterium]|nr:MAG: hypothetical protein A2Y39_05715 [Candidatus Delongbacteria bacterium GWF2_40_14]HAQ60788.1 hypothetical protein [Candidatus Delongbacteria bacterium]
MKKLVFLTAVAMIFSVYGLDLGFSAKTGDAEFDMFLNDVNNTAKVDLRTFRTEVSAEYKVDDKTMDAGLIKFKMEPAELYLSLEMAKIMKKDPAEVMKVYSENKKEGWGVIAKKMGIKPGSREFKGLKKKTQYKKDKHKRDKMKKESQKMQNDAKEKEKNLPEDNESKSDGKVDKKNMKSEKGAPKSGTK